MGTQPGCVEAYSSSVVGVRSLDVQWCTCSGCTPLHGALRPAAQISPRHAAQIYPSPRGTDIPFAPRHRYTLRPAAQIYPSPRGTDILFAPWHRYTLRPVVQTSPRHAALGARAVTRSTLVFCCKLPFCARNNVAISSHRPTASMVRQ